LKVPPIARWKTIRRTIQRGHLTRIRNARNGLIAWFDYLDLAL